MAVTLPPDALQHVLNVIGDDLLKSAVDAGLRKVAGVISRSVDRRVKNAEDLNDPDALRVEVERLRDVTEILRHELDELGKRRRPDAARFDLNASDPAFRSFVDDAFFAAAKTSLESKRGVLAAMIARRLQLRTDSTEEVLLRRAREVLEYLSEQQLLLLAAILLVQGFPTDDPMTKFSSHDEAEAWLRERYFNLARRLKNSTNWSLDDFEMLVALGAVRIDQSQINVRRSVGMTAVHQWLAKKGVDPHEGLEGEIGTKASWDAYRRRYPTISLLTQLALGERPRREPLGYELDRDVRFTPIGEYLAMLIFERLTGHRLQKTVLFVFPSDDQE